MTPDEHLIRTALATAALSPCRSKRGVVLWNAATGAHRGRGHNGPPLPFSCPGRDRCAGNCGQRSVHAEVRALRDAEVYRRYHESGPFELLHVELAADGGVVACSGPSCWQCAREILDVGFVAGVWLYEARHCTCGYGDRVGPHEIDCRIRPINANGEWDPGPHWIRYTAEEFYRVTLENCGVRP